MSCQQSTSFKSRTIWFIYDRSPAQADCIRLAYNIYSGKPAAVVFVIIFELQTNAYVPMADGLWQNGRKGESIAAKSTVLRIASQGSKSRYWWDDLGVWTAAYTISLTASHALSSPTTVVWTEVLYTPNIPRYKSTLAGWRNYEELVSTIGDCLGNSLGSCDLWTTASSRQWRC